MKFDIRYSPGGPDYAPFVADVGFIGGSFVVISYNSWEHLQRLTKDLCQEKQKQLEKIPPSETLEL